MGDLLSATSPAIARIPTSRLALYAAPWFATQVVFLPLVNFVPGHYSSDLGLPLFAVSLAMLGSRFLDLVIDPLIGAVSDRLKTPIGRRKPVVIVGAPVMILGAWLAFAPPDNPSPAYLFFALTTLFFGFALIQIPYVSWGAELSDDYDERSRVVGWREGVGVLGTLTAISSPFIVQQLTGRFDLGLSMFGIAAGVTLLLPLLLAPALALVPERREAQDEGAATKMTAIQHLSATLKNRELVWFLAATFVCFLGVAPGGATGFLMMKHLFNAESLYPAMVLGEFVTMLISVPLWALLAGKLGKHRAMAVSLAWMAAWTLPVPFLGQIDPSYVVVVTAIRGLGFGAAFVIPYSMVADVIDVDTLRIGRPRAGVLMAIAGINVKLALMIGVFVATAFPTWFGFEPARAANAPFAEFSVAVSYAWLTCLFWIAAVPLFWFYPLTREKQAETRLHLKAAQTSPEC